MLERDFLMRQINEAARHLARAIKARYEGQSHLAEERLAECYATLGATELSRMNHLDTMNLSKLLESAERRLAVAQALHFEGELALEKKDFSVASRCMRRSLELYLEIHLEGSLTIPVEPLRALKHWIPENSVAPRYQAAWRELTPELN